jgi:lysine 6-dehydrogenase
MKGVENMWEKTMRYPGHVEKIKLLIELGFFDNNPVEVKGMSIIPRDFPLRYWNKDSECLKLGILSL